MTANRTLSRAADRIRESGFVLPVFLVYVALLVMSVAFSWEDYWTSYYGYLSLPTQQLNAWMAYVVAALPQLGQVAAGYIVLSLNGSDDENDRRYFAFALFVWMVLFFIDIYTDMVFRMDVATYNGSIWELGLVALLQTVGIFTLGSELAFTIGFGMVVELFPDAAAQLPGLRLRFNQRLDRMRRQWGSGQSY